MKLQVRIDEQEKTVEIDEVDGLYYITIDGDARVVDCRNAGHGNYLSLLIDNRSHLVESAPIRVDEGSYYATVNGRRYDLDVLDERLATSRDVAAASAQSGPHVVSSPMPGLIVDVRVAVGDDVTAGAPVIVMEAMKMQNELVSEVDGVVKAVNVTVQDTVDSQVALVEIERHV